MTLSECISIMEKAVFTNEEEQKACAMLLDTAKAINTKNIGKDVYNFFLFDKSNIESRRLVYMSRRHACRYYLSVHQSHSYIDICAVERLFGSSITDHTSIGNSVVKNSPQYNKETKQFYDMLVKYFGKGDQ